MASWFKHIGGVLVLGVELPDGSAATVPAAATDVFGTVVVGERGLVLELTGCAGCGRWRRVWWRARRTGRRGQAGDHGGRVRGGAGMPGPGLGLAAGAGGF
jgi:hypothetical protein